MIACFLQISCLLFFITVFSVIMIIMIYGQGGLTSSGDQMVISQLFVKFLTF